MAIPMLFAVAGGEITYWCFVSRTFMSPTSGVLLGSGIAALSAIAAFRLWQASARAPLAIILSGASLVAAPYLVPQFRLVNASDEPPSFLMVYGLEIAMALVVAFSIGSALLARRWLRNGG